MNFNEKKLTLSKTKDANQELVIMILEEAKLDDLMTKLISVYGIESVNKTLGEK